MTGWFDMKEVDAFAQWAVTELGKRVPAKRLDVNDRKALERLGKMNDVISDKARDIAPRLNLFKRARLGNRVKWAMKEAGYPAEFIDTFTYELLTVITVAARAPAPNVKKP
jgi:hypothetical protein